MLRVALIHEYGGSPDNLDALRTILRRLMLQFPCRIVFSTPLEYYLALDDTDPSERETGMRAWQERLRREFDEAWAYGEAESGGCKIDLGIAFRIGVSCHRGPEREEHYRRLWRLPPVDPPTFAMEAVE